MTNEGVPFNEEMRSSNDLSLSHVKFTRHLHSIDWIHIARTTLPYLNQDKVGYLLSTAGAYSINPLILISSVAVDSDLVKTYTDRQFNQALRQRADDLARAHLEADEQSIYAGLDAAVRKVFQDDNYKLRKFFSIYTKLQAQFDIPVPAETDRLILKRQEEEENELRPSLQWPWEQVKTRDDNFYTNCIKIIASCII